MAPSDSGPDPSASAGVTKLPAATGASEASEVGEEDLVARAKQGDHAAYESLYRLNRDRIYGLLWRMSGGQHALAEDLLQDAFVRAWEKLELFRGESRFGTWLHRLAVNVALSDRRSRMRLAGKEVAMDEHVYRTAMGSEDVRADRNSDLEQSIAKLPERARTVLVLYDIEGYRHAEIAEMTGMAVGSSKAQLHRARQLLREELST